MKPPAPTWAIVTHCLWIGLLLGNSTPLAALPRAAAIPGGVVLLPLPGHEAEAQPPVARYQGRRVMVVAAALTGHPTSARWLAVVGIPLDAKVGPQRLEIEPGRQIDFIIGPAHYPEQHITVTNQRQVTPLPDDLLRIERERQQIDAAFDHWSSPTLPVFTLAAPVDAPRSGTFGVRRFFNGQPRKPHSGLDLAAPRGTAIQAPAAGRVIEIGDYFFNGKTVLIDHGQGLVTLYCHLEQVDVQRGASVQAGDTLGRVGMSGRATAPHLHWGVSLNGVRVDPALFLPPP